MTGEPPRSKRLGCWWSHDWTKWEDDPAPFTLHRNTGDPKQDAGIMGLRQIQRRRCTRCNMLQVRSVILW